MKAKNVERFFAQLGDVLADAFDHLAKRLATKGADFGDELEELGDLASKWTSLSKGARTRFTGELLKSAGLVTASAAATRVGIKVAKKSQKRIRKVLLTAADVIEPMGRAAGSKIKMSAKELKKTAKKAKDKAKKKAKKK